MPLDPKPTPRRWQAWASLALLAAALFLLPTGITGIAQGTPGAIIYLIGGAISALGMAALLILQALQRQRARNVVHTWADREPFEVDEDRRRGRDEDVKTNSVIAMAQGNKLGGNQHGSGLPSRWT